MSSKSFFAPVTWGRVSAKADRVVIVASGPSLRGFNLAVLRDLQQDAGVYVIAVNGASTAVPFADAWFTLDPHHLKDRLTPIAGGLWYAAIPDDFGTVYARIADHRAPPPKQVTYLHRLVGNGPLLSKMGLSEDPACIYTGNSAYGALGVAYHMRPKRVLMLGVDGTRGYFYNTNGISGDLAHLPPLFESATWQLQDRGITVINGSPNSIVTCFPRMTPDEGIRELLND